MQFRISPEDEAFKETVRTFLREELSDSWRITQEDIGLDDDHPEWSIFGRSFNQKLAARGWLTMHWPREYGGLGASIIRQVVYNEEMAYAGAPAGLNMGVSWVGPIVMLYGSESQKASVLSGIAAHEQVWCTLYSEPGAGSDLSAIKASAILDGDEWILNGQKIWTTGAHRSDWGLLVARTDPDAPRHKGLSMFLVPMTSPGITVRPLINLAGQHSFNEVFFDGVRVARDHIVGERNRGWYQLAVALDFERSSISGVARSRRMFDSLLACIRANPRILGTSVAWRHRLAELSIDIAVGQNLSYRVACIQEAGRIPNHEASIAKLWASELGQRLARAGINLLGLQGLLQATSEHSPMSGMLARYYLVSVAETIGGGTSEIMRNVVAQRGLGLPRG